MSVIIALKYNKGVALAADKQVTMGCQKNDNSSKIYKTKYSNCGIGVSGSARNGDILACEDELMEYKDILDKIEIDFKYMVSTIVPNLIKIFRKNGRINNNEVDSYFLYCTKNKIFTICDDFSVIEFDKYWAIGCGANQVIGYLSTLNLDKIKKDEARDIIITAINKSCENNIHINDKIDIIYLEDIYEQK